MVGERNERCERRGWRRGCDWLVALLFGGGAVAVRVPAGTLPEPNAIFYGTAAVEGIPAQMGDEVSARIGGDVLASYVMGSNTDAQSRNWYVLEVPVVRATAGKLRLDDTVVMYFNGFRAASPVVSAPAQVERVDRNADESQPADPTWTPKPTGSRPPTDTPTITATPTDTPTRAATYTHASEYPDRHAGGGAARQREPAGTPDPAACGLESCARRDADPKRAGGRLGDPHGEHGSGRLLHARQSDA